MKSEPMLPSTDQSCPVTHCLHAIGGKWKPVIVFCIANGVDRFGAMQRSIPDITKQMLTKQLRELEADGLLTREVFAEVPPRVEYALSTRGRSILPVIQTMRDWGLADQARAKRRDGDLA